MCGSGGGLTSLNLSVLHYIDGETGDLHFRTNHFIFFFFFFFFVYVCVCWRRGLMNKKFVFMKSRHKFDNFPPFLREGGGWFVTNFSS